MSILPTSVSIRLFIALFLVVFISAPVCFILYYVSKIQEPEAKHRLDNQLHIISKLERHNTITGIIFQDKEHIKAQLSRLDSLEDIVGVAIYDSIGRLYVHHNCTNEPFYFPEHLEEFKKMDANFSILIDPILFKNVNYGNLVLLASYTNVDKLHTNFIYNVLYFSGGTVFLFLVLSYLALGYYLKPVQLLSEASNHIYEKGNYHIHLPEFSFRRMDEIQKLYNSFKMLLEKQKVREQEQKAQQLELKRSERQYRNLFENSMVGIFSKRLESNTILRANRKTYEIFGLDPTEKLQIELHYVRDEDRRKLIQTLKSLNVIDNYEVEMFRKDDSTIWVMFSGRYFSEDDRVECVIQDISENKRNYIELQKANFELDSFVYHASHDLRSPLRSVLGLVQISTYESDISIIRGYMEMIQRTVVKLDNLVQELLTLSRTTRLETEFTSINFRDCLSNSLDNLAYMDIAKRVQKYTEVIQEVPFYTDKTRVEIILNNLISNAIKYQKTNESQPYLKISIIVNTQVALIRVEDNGEGIQKTSQVKIFEMFKRDSENSEGSGLGLYIVKNVVEKIHGKIWVESVHGKGSVFYVELPNLNKEG